MVEILPNFFNFILILKIKLLENFNGLQESNKMKYYSKHKPGCKAEGHTAALVPGQELRQLLSGQSHGSECIQYGCRWKPENSFNHELQFFFK